MLHVVYFYWVTHYIKKKKILCLYKLPNYLHLFLLSLNNFAGFARRILKILQFLIFSFQYTRCVDRQSWAVRSDRCTQVTYTRCPVNARSALLDPAPALRGNKHFGAIIFNDPAREIPFKKFPDTYHCNTCNGQWILMKHRVVWRNAVRVTWLISCDGRGNFIPPNVPFHA